MAAPRQQTGNRAKDVANPLFKEAEARVFEWLKASKGAHNVTDCRSQRTFYDFILNGAWTVDVKVDQYMHATSAVAWEEWLFIAPQNDIADVRKAKGWGQHEGLVYVVYVAPLSEGTWPAFVMHLPKMKEVIYKYLSKNGPESLKAWHKQGDERDATGYVVPLALLLEGGAIVEQARV